MNLPETLARIEAEARRYAGHYPPASDGRNTFVIFADWVANLAHAAPAPSDEAVGTYIEKRLSEGGLKLVSGSPTMLSDEFARYEAERLADEPEAGVPAGMVLVPVEPTEAMLEALARQAQKPTGWHDVYPAMYRAMLAAAPKQATPTDEAVLGEREQIVWRQDAAPQDGSTICGHSWRPYRWKAYSPKSEQFRHGINGRWQAMNEFAGWDNAEAPDEWATSEQIDARRARPAPGSAGEASDA